MCCIITNIIFCELEEMRHNGVHAGAAVWSDLLVCCPLSIRHGPGYATDKRSNNSSRCPCHLQPKVSEGEEARGEGQRRSVAKGRNSPAIRHERFLSCEWTVAPRPRRPTTCCVTCSALWPRHETWPLTNDWPARFVHQNTHTVSSRLCRSLQGTSHCQHPAAAAATDCDVTTLIYLPVTHCFIISMMSDLLHGRY